MKSSRNTISIVNLSVLTFVLTLAHEGLAYGLDRAELIERLLSPGDPSVLLVLLLGVAFFALRLGLLFVLPGVWLYVLATALWARLPLHEAKHNTKHA